MDDASVVPRCSHNLVATWRDLVLIPLLIIDFRILRPFASTMSSEISVTKKVVAPDFFLAYFSGLRPHSHCEEIVRVEPRERERGRDIERE
ncbi:hypothetical protein HPP92_020836 [Vanilla planifolia]|uniref:Uncharacterized protein n=1 Tax=Vanilla planifolia TaxID=51239 RepID=A0A835UEZ1_VANPL|nr:hypothetical protein HPP92_020836 [Vanilla planifolia]